MTFSPSPCCSTRRAEPLESPVCHLRPIAEASEPGAGGFHGVGVTVEAEHAHVGARVQQRGRVATATHRAVDNQPFRAPPRRAPPPPGPSPEDARTPPPRCLLAAFAGTASPPIPSSAPRSTGTARDVSPSRLRLKAGGVGANNRAGRGAEDEPGTRTPSRCQELGPMHVHPSANWYSGQRKSLMPSPSTMDAIPAASRSANICASQISMWSKLPATMTSRSRRA